MELKSFRSLDTRGNKPEEMGGGGEGGSDQRGGCLKISLFRLTLFIMTISRLRDTVMGVRAVKWSAGRVIHLDVCITQWM